MAGSDAMMHMGRPQSIKEIVQTADDYSWDSRIPYKYWVRAADTIFREATVYFQEGNLSHAYLMYFRYTTLVIDRIKGHPDARKAENRELLKPLLSRTPVVFDRLEEIKPQLEAIYEEWEKDETRRKAHAARTPGSQYERFASKDPALSWHGSNQPKILDAGEHQDLALELARKEIRRRETVRKRRREAGVTEDAEHERRAAGVWDNWDARVSNGQTVPRSDDLDFQQQMEATRRRLNRADDAFSRPGVWDSQDNLALNEPREHNSATYHYPSISKSTPLHYDSRPNKLRKEPPLHPPRPPKETPPPPRPPPYRHHDSPPSRPAKELLPTYEESFDTQQVSAAPPSVPPKMVDEKKERYTFRPAAYLENGDPLRSVFIPSGLRQRFLEVAADNTRQELEMCGMLCGTLVNNALFISCLLIPEQKCTTDTCETENEGEMFEYCMNNDLLLVGWIHTHPTQTCFMSSRDLHTHAGYQVMMKESIAIVCAPRHTPSYGIFRLTNPPGLPHILACNHTDTFHQHSIDKIYTDADHPPGHVYETLQLDFYVHDLRPKK